MASGAKSSCLQNSSKVCACKQSSLLHLGPNKKSSKCLINSLGRYKNIMRKTICLRKKKGGGEKEKLAGPGWLLMEARVRLCGLQWPGGLA